MPDNLDIDVVTDLAIQVGARVAREYPGIDAEDVAQEAVTGFLEDGVRTADRDYAYTVLYRHGNSYAAKERYDYILTSSHYLYRREEVKALLEEAYFQVSSHEVPTAKDSYLSAEIEGKTVYVSLLDMGVAWERLSGAHQGVLYSRFRDGVELHHETVTRAVDALTRAMNIHINRQQDTSGPGFRTALSNAQAQHETEE